MFILCQTATKVRELSAVVQIIADVYFVSNRNVGWKHYIYKPIIADVYFVSNRNASP